MACAVDRVLALHRAYAASRVPAFQMVRASTEVLALQGAYAPSLGFSPHFEARVAALVPAFERAYSLLLY